VVLLAQASTASRVSFADPIARVNITAVVITFVSAVASNSEESVLTAVQLLWVNLCVTARLCPHFSGAPR
jgi:magnesium-transporting ATPase (P-type)